MTKVNIGCGSVKPRGWVNVDYSLGARLTRVPFYNLINRRLKLFDLNPSGNPRNWDSVIIHDLRKEASLERREHRRCICFAHH